MRRTSPSIAAWILAAGFALLALIRVAGLDRGVLLVQLIAFTPYLALASIVGAIIVAATRRWWALGVIGVATVTLLGCVVPRAFPVDPPHQSSATLTVMALNMRLGGADATSIVDLVRQARVDVLALQEFSADAEQGVGRGRARRRVAVPREPSGSGRSRLCTFLAGTAHGRRSQGGGSRWFQPGLRDGHATERPADHR
jgi:hypothetical protein